MKSAALLSIIILLFTFNVRAQNLYLTVNDIKFKTEEEKKLFTAVLEKKGDEYIFPLLMNNNEPVGVSISSANTRIDNAVRFIKENFMKAKTDEKRIKQIYDYVHKEFLVVYNLENNFSEIFKDGKFNCVSASALYAVIFSRLGIPYSIKELPTHVYLVAYPGTSPIYIETTSPTAGYYQFNETFIQKYVEQLLSSKQISQKEMDTSSVEKIFRRKFYADSDIDLLKLAALQYYNLGIYLSDKKKYTEAIEWLKKAYILYPTERISFTLKNALLNVIGGTSKLDIAALDLYMLFIQFNSKDKIEFPNEDVVKILGLASEEILITKSDVAGFKNFYAGVSAIVKDSSLEKELSFIYNYQLARYSILNGKKDSLETYLERAYKLNPDNSYLKALISDNVMARVNVYNEVNAVYKLLTSSKDKYPFLLESENFNYVMTSCYLEYAYQNFSNRNSTKGEDYLLKAEKLIKDKQLSSPNEGFITKAYSEAGVYYYRIGNKAKASERIKAGLRYYPENFKLIEIQKQLK